MTAITVAATVFFQATTELGFFCRCKAFWNVAIGSGLVSVIALARALFSGERGYLISAGMFAFEAAVYFDMWRRERKDCDHNDHRGKRIKAWLRSKIRRPKVLPSRVQPQPEGV